MSFTKRTEVLTNAEMDEGVVKLAKRQMKQAVEIIENAEKRRDTFAALNDVGVYLARSGYDLNSWSDFEVSSAQLPAIRKALGKLKVMGSYDPVSGEEENNMVWVTVQPEDEQYYINLKYKSKLSTNAKCKMKKIVHAPMLGSTTSYAVVCERE